MKLNIGRTCDVDGCLRKHYGLGFCERHYQQVKKYGKPINGPRSRQDPNEFIIKSDHCIIKIYDNSGNPKTEAVIDIDDYNKVKNKKWYQSEHGYICYHKDNGVPEYLHRIIMNGSSRKKQIDHIDRDKKNNRKSNFRFATPQQNLMNKPARSGTKSKYKGVRYRGTSYSFTMRKGCKRFYVGGFKNSFSAALAYNRAAEKHHGEFAFLNIVTIPVNEEVEFVRSKI